MKKEILLAIILAAVIIVLLGILIFWPAGNKDIRALSVSPGQTISSPLSVEGEARGKWFFEASFPVKITDEQGNVLGSSFAAAQGDWMTENFVPFKAQLSYASKTGGKGFLVLAKDNPSGLPEYDEEVKIPVILSPAGYTKVKVFLNNSKLDSEASCNKVFPVEREIMNIEAIGSASLQELFKGPTQTEKDEGYFTSINNGVVLKSLTIDLVSGTARADFNEQLETGVGGSCRVSAIRAQITETLKQFPTIKSVIISINGRTEDILQP